MTGLMFFCASLAVEDAVLKYSALINLPELEPPGVLKSAEKMKRLVANERIDSPASF
jgi:hypothetical protein